VKNLLDGGSVGDTREGDRAGDAVIRLTVYSWRDLPQAQHSLRVRVPQFSVTEHAGPNYNFNTILTC